MKNRCLSYIRQENQMTKFIATIPNWITSIRIIGSVILLFIKPFTNSFYIIYTLCGLSDVADGAVARFTKNSTEFGAKLDSIADMLFYAIMLLKVFPVLWDILPGYTWYIVAFVIILRLCSYIVAAVKYHKFASLHTYLNKLTGLIIFTVPYFLKLPIGVHVCFAVTIIAGLASLEELLIHIRKGKYTKTKTIIKATHK